MVRAPLTLIALLLAWPTSGHSETNSNVMGREEIVERLAAPSLRTRGLVKVTEEPKRIAFDNIEFEHDSSTLNPEAREQLVELGAALNSRDLQQFRFEIAGHTDARGEDAYNHQLSLDRARSVARFLSDVGVDTARLQVVGQGERQPIAGTRSEDARNRRVEVINLGPG